MIVNLLRQIVALLQELVARPNTPADTARLDALEAEVTALRTRFDDMDEAIGDTSLLPVLSDAPDPQGDIDGLPKL